MQPILPTILRVAAPNIALVVVQVASSTVDAFFVGRLGPEALAGVSLVFPGWMLMVTMSAGGMGGGISSAVARGLGAGRREHAQALFGHALLIAVLMGTLFSAVFVLAGPGIYSALGGSGETLAAAVAYSNAVFGGALAVWVLNSLASSMRGSGEMLVPALVVVAGEVLHIGLAAGLIFGLGPLPSLGVAGAGLSLAHHQHCTRGGAGPVRAFGSQWAAAATWSTSSRAGRSSRTSCGLACQARSTRC